jgi:hypothetical protein
LQPFGARGRRRACRLFDEAHADTATRQLQCRDHTCGAAPDDQNRNLHHASLDERSADVERFTWRPRSNWAMTPSTSTPGSAPRLR